MKNLRRTFRVMFQLGFALVAPAAPAGASQPTPLDLYVAAPDTNYTWRLVKTVTGSGYTGHVLQMTSQAWLTTNEVDRPLWNHWLTLVRPDLIEHTTALLFIGGGRNNRPGPDEPDRQTIEIARATRSVVAELRQVPNQPLQFKGETTGRDEDALIAYTWDKFLRTGDARWPARLPMTKSAVRALDTVTAFCASPEGGRRRVDRFVVAGGSKRGWTTWTTAAVDPRVVAIVPIVIDMLNIRPSFIHHWEAYGFYAPAIADYEELGIMQWQGTPEYRRLMDIVEPFSYRTRFTMPKCIINACGDQFFLPDSSQFYFNELPGPKFIRYVPNADHSLRDTDAVNTLTAFYHAILNHTPLPQIVWALDPTNGTLTVSSTPAPQAAVFWQAANPGARDFRLETLGALWTQTPLRAEADHRFIAHLAAPAKGWAAGLVELSFNLPGCPVPLKCSTEVLVVPDRLPFKFQPPSPPAH